MINQSIKKIFGPSKPAGSSRAPDKSLEFEKELRGHVFTVNKRRVSVEAKIAEGGFAIVYLVRCNTTNRLLALKRQFVNDFKHLEGCKKEIQIIEALSSHKNIVKYIDSHIHQKSDGIYEYMLLTKYYRRDVLQVMNEYLSTGKYFVEEEVLRIFCDIVEAVSRLHHCQTPVIHRDLKVENILIDDDGTYVLCDFGSATNRVFSTSTHPTAVVEEEITKYTTLSYRSPEMVDLYAGRPITTKSDIWALGVCLYKLCYFTLPFGESALAIQNGTFTFPSVPQFSPYLLALIRYMLEPDMDLRPDIFQVASVAFQLAERKCLVGNLHNSIAPSLSDLLLRLRTAYGRQFDNICLSPPSILGNQSPLPAQEPFGTSTTVTPRQRPKGFVGNANPMLLKGTEPWKAKSGVNALATTYSEQSMPESISNPNLSSIMATTCSFHGLPAGGIVTSNVAECTVSTSQLTGSHSIHGLSQHQIVAPQVPVDCLFPNLEPPSPFVPLEPPEGPLVSLSPPGRISAMLPSSSSIDALIVGHDTVSFVPVCNGSIAFSSSSHHRRNMSDTSAINIGGHSSDRPSAFKPYYSTGATNLVANATTSFACGQQSSEPSLHFANQAATTAEAFAVSTRSSASSSASSPAVDLLIPQPSRGVAANADVLQTDPSVAVNPFLVPSGPPLQTGSRAIASTSMTFTNKSAEAALLLHDSGIDDARFGFEFDEIPRRHGSLSSIKNVKSRESLVMDERDPFGSAPFLPPATKSKHKTSRDSAKQSDVKVSSNDKAEKPADADASQQAKQYLNVPGMERFTRRRSKAAANASGATAAGDAADVKPAIPNSTEPSTLSNLTNNLMPMQAAKYQKLIDMDDDEGVASSSLRGSNPSASTKGLSRVRDEECDSVGSASDLRERMQQMMTSDDDEESAAGADAKPDVGYSDDDSSYDCSQDQAVCSATGRVQGCGGEDFVGYQNLTGYTGSSDGGSTKRLSTAGCVSTLAGGVSNVACPNDDGNVDTNAIIDNDRNEDGSSASDGNLYPDDVDAIERLGHRPLLDDMDDELECGSSIVAACSTVPAGAFNNRIAAPSNCDSIELNVFRHSSGAEMQFRQPTKPGPFSVGLAEVAYSSETALSPAAISLNTPSQESILLPRDQVASPLGSSTKLSRAAQIQPVHGVALPPAELTLGKKNPFTTAGALLPVDSVDSTDHSVPIVSVSIARNSPMKEMPSLPEDAFGFAPFNSRSIAIRPFGNASKQNHVSMLPSPPPSRSSRKRVSPTVSSKSEVAIGKPPNSAVSAALEAANEKAAASIGNQSSSVLKPPLSANATKHLHNDVASNASSSCRTAASQFSPTSATPVHNNNNTIINDVIKANVQPAPQLPPPAYNSPSASETTTSDEETSFGGATKADSHHRNSAGKMAALVTPSNAGSLGRSKKSRQRAKEMDIKSNESLPTVAKPKIPPRSKRKDEAMEDSAFVNTSFQNEDFEENFSDCKSLNNSRGVKDFSVPKKLSLTSSSSSNRNNSVASLDAVGSVDTVTKRGSVGSNRSRLRSFGKSTSGKH